MTGQLSPLQLTCNPDRWIHQNTWWSPLDVLSVNGESPKIIVVHWMRKVPSRHPSDRTGIEFPRYELTSTIQSLILRSDYSLRNMGKPQPIFKMATQNKVSSTRQNTETTQGISKDPDTPPDQWTEKKLAVVEAAIAILADKGYEGTTTAAIARKAGVGEGTIYRYFNNKSDLIDSAAGYVSSSIFSEIREKYDPHDDVHDQFTTFCRLYLESGRRNPGHHQFIGQYINSPAGVNYRKRILREIETNPDIKPYIYPLNRIIRMGIEQKRLRKIPLQVLISLTMGPLTFILKQSAQGFFDLDEILIAEIAESCWAAIRIAAR